MLMTKLKVTITVVLALNLVGAGVGLVYCQTTGTGQDKQRKPAVAQENPNVPLPTGQKPAPRKFKFAAIVFDHAGNRAIFEGRITAQQFQKWFKKNYAVEGERIETPRDATAFGTLVLTDGDEVLVMPFYKWGGDKQEYFACQSHAIGEAPMFRVLERSEESFLKSMKSTLGGIEKDESSEVSLKDLPDFQSDAFKVDPYLRAAAALQGMDKDKATETLLALAREEKDGKRVIVLCRMLFTSKAGGEFRRPALGAAAFLGGTTYADWPLEPIELVDGVPFLITRGYALEGVAELSEGYLRYCLQECAWRGERFQTKSEREKKKALEKLLTSPKWKSGLEAAEKEFLSAQIK